MVGQGGRVGRGRFGRNGNKAAAPYDNCRPCQESFPPVGQDHPVFHGENIFVSMSFVTLAMSRNQPRSDLG